MTDRVRAGIVGVGFMGTVHARAVRRAGGVVSRIVGSSPESSRAGAERIGAEFAAETVEELLAADDVDVVHVCTPNATHARWSGRRSPPASTWSARSPWRSTPPRPRSWSRLAAAAGVTATVPFVYRFYPTVREARARVADGTRRPGAAAARLLPAGLAGRGRRRQLAGRRRRRRSLPGVRRHRRALVRPGRVRLRPPDHPGRRPHRRRRPRRAAAGTVTTEDAAVVLFETDRGATGNLTISQISPGRKNRLWFSVDGATESLCFDQENPESLWIGGREVNRQLLRGTSEGPAAGALHGRPGRPPAGLPGLLRRLRRRHLRRDRRRRARRAAHLRRRPARRPHHRRPSSSRRGTSSWVEVA